MGKYISSCRNRNHSQVLVPWKTLMKVWCKNLSNLIFLFYNFSAKILFQQNRVNSFIKNNWSKVHSIVSQIVSDGNEKNFLDDWYCWQWFRHVSPLHPYLVIFNNLLFFLIDHVPTNVSINFRGYFLYVPRTCWLLHNFLYVFSVCCMDVIKTSL